MPGGTAPVTGAAPGDGIGVCGMVQVPVSGSQAAWVPAVRVVSLGRFTAGLLGDRVGVGIGCRGARDRQAPAEDGEGDGGDACLPGELLVRADGVGVLVTRQEGLGPRGRHPCPGGRVREVGGRVHVDALAEQVALDGVHEVAGRAVLGGQVEHPVGVEGTGDRVADGVGLSLGAGERGHVLLETGGLGLVAAELVQDVLEGVERLGRWRGGRR